MFIETYDSQLEPLHILVDPFFSARSTLDPFPFVQNQSRNPLVDLPRRVRLERLVQDTDIVLLTHPHVDHWDEAAQTMLLARQRERSLTIYCQPSDYDMLKGQGFEDVRPIADMVIPVLPPGRRGIQIYRTVGEHGVHPTLVEAMGKVSGFVIGARDTKIFIAGDSVWTEGVRDALDQHRPDVVVLNTGGAEFEEGPWALGRITMNEEDVLKVYRHCAENLGYVPAIHAVHMDALNHCGVTRVELSRRLHAALAEAPFRDDALRAIHLPEDGARIEVR